MNVDLINACFEATSGAVSLLNVRALLKSKEVRGVHWAVTAFFTAWGFWNLIYYPAMHQWISFVGGIGIVLVNAVWLALVFYFRRRSWVARS